MSIQIDNFRPDVRNTRRGYFNIVLPKAGLVLRDWVLHLNSGSWWVSPYARSYDKDGEKKWWPLTVFTDDEAKKRFQNAVLEALRAFTPETFGEQAAPRPGNSLADAARQGRIPAPPSQRAVSRGNASQAPVGPTSREPNLDDEIPF